jgi:hypothetical protein
MGKQIGEGRLPGPMATSRLQALGDILSLEVAEVVCQTVRRVR